MVNKNINKFTLVITVLISIASINCQNLLVSDESEIYYIRHHICPIITKYNSSFENLTSRTNSYSAENIDKKVTTLSKLNYLRNDMRDDITGMTGGMNRLFFFNQSTSKAIEELTKVLKDNPRIQSISQNYIDEIKEVVKTSNKKLNQSIKQLKKLKPELNKLYKEFEIIASYEASLRSKLKVPPQYKDIKKGKKTNKRLVRSFYKEIKQLEIIVNSFGTQELTEKIKELKKALKKRPPSYDSIESYIDQIITLITNAKVQIAKTKFKELGRKIIDSEYGNLTSKTLDEYLASSLYSENNISKGIHIQDSLKNTIKFCQKDLDKNIDSEANQMILNYFVKSVTEVNSKQIDDYVDDINNNSSRYFIPEADAQNKKVNSENIDVKMEFK